MLAIQRFTITLPVLAGLLLLPAEAPPSALELTVERLTGKAFAAGDSGDFVSRVLEMTPDGRYLLILTQASNVMAGVPDTNGVADLLVHDRVAGTSEWVTLSYHDPERLAMSQIGSPATISADGRFVAFASAGHPHAAGSTGQMPQVYLFDRQTRTTVKVSHPPGNPQSHGNHASWLGLALSQDGRYLAFESDASNLVTGTDENFGTDVFQYDRTTGINTLVSHSFAAPGTTSNGRKTLRGMSADGRFILLQTHSSDLIAGFVNNNGSGDDAYLWDRDSNSSVLVSRSAGSASSGADAEVTFAVLSADGSRAALVTAATNLVAGFTDNNGGEADSYVFERATGTLQLVSGVSATASQNLGSFASALSADGGHLFFFSPASDVIPGLVRPADGGNGLFRFDTASREMALINHKAGQPTAIALGDALSVRAAEDGEAVVFVSASGEMVAGQSAAGGGQVFAYDLATGTARLVSHLAGQPLAGALGDPVGISADHRYAAFNSPSPQISGNDHNTYEDAFLYDLGVGAASRLSNAATPGRTLSRSHFEQLESIPSAGLFLFHTNDVTPFLPGIVDQGGLDPVLVDPRTGTLSALFAPGGATPDGDSRATFLPDGLNFLLRSSGSNLIPGMADGNGAGADLYAGNRTRGGLQLISSSAASASASGNAGVGLYQAFSENGRFVAYSTFATDAVAGASDTNGAEDVILEDRQLGTRVLVSRAAATAATAGNARSYPVAMSADGELLLFASRATDLLPAFVDRNGTLGEDYFLYRRSTGALTLVTHAAVSATTTGNFGSTSGRLSADGQWVFFVTTSRNLVAGGTDHNGDQTDVFGYQTATGVISRLSHVPDEPLRGVNGDVQLVTSSPDGRYLLLTSSATNLTNATHFYSAVAYNAFVYDRVLDQATLISHLPFLPFSSLGTRAHAVAMSDDARFVVFTTEALNVVPGQIFESLMHAFNHFLVDRATGERAILSRSVTSPLATANAAAGQLALGQDARHALFLSFATNLSPYVPYQATEVYLARTAIGDIALFRDGFESGDTSAWSTSALGE